jgi:hypothetical protein
MGAAPIHVDRCTDMIKLICAFRDCVNGPRNDITFILPRLLYSMTSNMIIVTYFLKLIQLRLQHLSGNAMHEQRNLKRRLLFLQMCTVFNIVFFMLDVK